MIRAIAIILAFAPAAIIGATGVAAAPEESDPIETMRWFRNATMAEQISFIRSKPRHSEEPVCHKRDDGAQFCGLEYLLLHESYVYQMVVYEDRSVAGRGYACANNRLADVRECRTNDGKDEFALVRKEGGQFEF